MGKINVKEPSDIEGDLVKLGASETQARVIGAVLRGVASDILNERSDKIAFRLNGINYNLTLERQ